MGMDSSKSPEERYGQLRNDTYDLYGVVAKFYREFDDFRTETRERYDRVDERIDRVAERIDEVLRRLPASS